MAAGRLVASSRGARGGGRPKINRFLSNSFAIPRNGLGSCEQDAREPVVPYTVGQCAGIVVTAIVVLGCDMDLAWAMPLGVLAGALATFFVSLADARLQAKKA